MTRRGRYDFPTDDRWIPLDRHSSSFSFSFNDATHFVWFSQRRPLQNSRPDIIVVTRPGTDSFTALLFFWACIFLFFAILVLLARFFYLAVRWWGNGRSSLSLGFVSKMQLAFLCSSWGRSSLLVCSLLSIWYVPTNIVVMRHCLIELATYENIWMNRSDTRLLCESFPAKISISYART